MLEKAKTIGKGSVIAFAVLGVLAIVTTFIKMRRAQKELSVELDTEENETASTDA